MQAAQPGGGAGRRRQALTIGDVLPCQLLGQLELSGELADGRLDPSPDACLPGKTSTEQAVGGVPDAAPAHPPVAAAPAAPDSPATTTEPLPAYKSLARQQLQQRLKAAIAAGTGPSPAAPSVAQQPSSLPSPAAAQARAGRQQGAGGQPGNAALPPLGSRARSAQGAVSPLPALSQQWPLAGVMSPSLADAQAPAAGDSFQLPLPSRERQAAVIQQSDRSPAAHPGAAPSAELPSAQAQLQQGVQRGPLALLLPPLTEQLAGMMPARLQGADGTTSLIVLPSDGPSSRQEAVTAAAALEQLMADPAGAAQRAAAWRQQLLLRSSSAALLGITADYAPLQHAGQLRQAGGGGAAACGSGSSSSPLAGPAWLAGGSSKGECLCSGRSGVSLSPESSSTVAPPAAVDAVRSSSSFLRQSSGASRSSSPLPPLALPRVPSRLGGAAAAAAAGAAGAAATATAVGSLGALPSAAPLDCAAQMPAAALLAQQSQQQQQPAAPPAQPDPAWEGHCSASLTAALAVCMAEAVRQVEVGCAERGRLLARLWNSYTAALGAAVRQQQAQIDELLVANANLGAEASQLRWEARSAEFLRKEINRLRKDAEGVTLQLEDCQQEVEALRQDLAAAAEQQQGLEALLRRRLAALRWRWAAAAVLLPRQQVAGLLPGCRLASISPSSDNPLLQQILALEAAAAAEVQARQQLREHRQRSRAEAALAAALAAPTSGMGGSRGTPAKQHAPSRLGAGSSGSGSPAGPVPGHQQPPPLACLRPEARAAVLLSLPVAQRQQALAGMTDAERAAIVLHLDEATRAQIVAEMGPALAAATDAAIWRKPMLAARLLASMPADQAAAQLCSRATQAQQAGVLEVLPPQQASALLLGQPAVAQQQLLGSMSGRGAAALVEWLPPAAALQLLLPPTPSGAADAASSSQPSNAGTGVASVAAAWAPKLLSLLPDRHVAAMLSLAHPWEAAALLQPLEPTQQLRLLQQLPPGLQAAAQAALQQLRAAEARQRAAAAEQAAHTPTDATDQPSQAAAGAASEPPQTLDAATSLLALFQQLSAAERTHMLLMGSPGAAAPLLLHLHDSEVSDVMLLLPPQRQEALLLALHPAHEQRVRWVMREATRRRSSLLLPQHMAAAAVAVAAEEGGALQQQGDEEAAEASLAGEFQRLRRASSLSLNTAVLRRASSLSLNAADALSTAAAAMAAAPAARPGTAAGRQRQGSWRGSLLAPAQHEASQQRRDSRCASALA